MPPRAVAGYLNVRIVAMRATVAGFFFFISVNAFACSDHQWHRRIGPSDGGINEIHATKENVEFFSVKSASLAEAKAMLNIYSWISIKLDFAESLVGRTIELRAGYSPYLLRGLRYPTTNSKMTVELLSNGVVSVHFGWLGGEGGALYEAPIVALLQNAPKDIAVYCSGAA